MVAVRIRSRNDFKTYSRTRDYTTYGSTIMWDEVTPGLLETVPHDFAYMQDVVGNPGGFNPVDHYTFVGNFADPSDYLWNYGWTEHEVPFHVAHTPETHSSIPRKLEPGGPSAALLSEWSTEAFNKFHDQIPEQIKLANFLYELRDIKGLIPKIVKRSPIKTVSSNFLGLEFGIKPMITDLKAIINLADSVDKRIKYLKSTAGQTVSLSFKRDIPDPGPYLLTWPYNGSNARYFDYKRLSSQGTFQVTGKLRQDLSDLDGLASHLKALAAATGFNNPLAIVWEAIPYSFVVDWLFHLDSIIGTLAIQPFGGEWQLSNVGYSWKIQEVYAVYRNFLVAGDWGNSLEYLGTINTTKYVRKPGFPMLSLFACDLALSPKQLALSLALLDQRR